MSLRINSLLAAASKDRSAGAKLWVELGGYGNFFADVPKFIVPTADCFREEVREYADLLVDDALLRLPFPAAYFEFQDYLGSSTVGCLALLSDGTEMDDGIPRVHILGAIINPGREWFFVSAQSGWLIEKQADKTYETNWMLPEYPPAFAGKPLEKELLAAEHMARMVGCAIAFMDLQEAEFRPSIVTDQVAKKRQKAGKAPLYTHHVLVLTATARRAIAERKKGLIERRAHWRRGHLRHLPNKIIPVAPALVRGVGFVSKDYRL